MRLDNTCKWTRDCKTPRCTKRSRERGSGFVLNEGDGESKIRHWTTDLACNLPSDFVGRVAKQVEPQKVFAIGQSFSAMEAL
jgi:hypothetical protein